MSFKSFSQQGYLLTAKEIKPLENLILAQYREANKLINKELQKLFLKMPNLKPQDQYNWFIQYDRNIKLQNKIKAIYKKYDKKAELLQIESSQLAMANNYYRQFYTLNWLDYPFNFAILDENLIEYAIDGQIKTFRKIDQDLIKRLQEKPSYIAPAQTITSTIQKNQKEALVAIQSTINSNMLAGNSYRDTAKAINKIFGTTTKQKSTGQMAKAMRIARTEGSRMLSIGSFQAGQEAQAQGADIVKVWDATFDSRTRPAHASADGQQKELDEPFIVGGERLMYPADPAGSAENTIQCRCDSINIIRGDDLGSQRGREPDYKDADGKWIKGKSKIYSFDDFDKWAKSYGLKKNKYGQYYN